MKKILKTHVSKFFAILIVFVCFFTNTVAENKKIFEGKHFVMATSANFPPLEYVILDESCIDRILRNFYSSICSISFIS